MPIGKGRLVVTSPPCNMVSSNHLQRYVNEFADRRNILDRDTLDQIRPVVTGLVGHRLLSREFTA